MKKRNSWPVTFVVAAILIMTCSSCMSAVTPIGGDPTKTAQRVTPTFDLAPTNTMIVPTPEVNTVKITITPSPSFTVFRKTPVPYGGTKQPTIQESLDSLFFFDENGMYQFFDNISALDGTQISSNVITFPEGGSPIKLEFANYANLVAYQDSYSNVWISDFQGVNKKQVYQGEPDAQVELEWAPDDKILFINYPDGQETAKIFNIETNRLDEWHYTCDLVALSPKTKQAAIWCFNTYLEGDFAVLDWGQEPWFTTSSPDNAIFEVPPDKKISSKHQVLKVNNFVGWSRDGSLLAYFDPQKSEYPLQISNSQGKILKTSARKGEWLSEEDYVFVPGRPLQWAIDSRYLLLLGSGDTEYPCPQVQAPDDSLDISGPCWQVISTQSGDIIWTMRFETDGLSLNSELFLLGEATISANGEAVAFSFFYPGYYGMIVENIALAKLLLRTPLRVSSIRWVYD